MSNPRVQASPQSSLPFGEEAKPGFRSKTAATRLTPDELDEIEAAAESAGQALSEWLRGTALCATRQRPADPAQLVMIAMCLGLRISEIRALQWPDFDLKGRILTLTRSIVGRYVWNGGKAGASEDEVFLDSKASVRSGGLAEAMCRNAGGLAIR